MDVFVFLRVGLRWGLIVVSGRNTGRQTETEKEGADEVERVSSGRDGGLQDKR